MVHRLWIMAVVVTQQTVFFANANGGDSINYVPLELYLAGFVPAGSVTNIQVPTGVNCSLDHSVPNKTSFTATGLNTVTIGQIQTALGGARNPDNTTSQKAFRAGMVVVSQYALNATEMAFFNDWSRVFGDDFDDGSGLKSFADATGNVATMNTQMPPDKQVTVEKKLDTTSILAASSRITYTITITNGSTANITGLTVADAIPANTTFVASSAQADPPIINLTNFPNTTAGFTLNSNSSVSIVYSLDIAGGVNEGDPIKNTVTLSAPSFLQVVTNTVSTSIGADIEPPTLDASPLITPTGGITLTTNRPLFDAKDATDNKGVVQYTWTISNDQGTLDLQIRAIDTITTSVSQYTPSQPLPNGNYSWMITAEDAAGNKTTSGAATFSIDAPSNLYLPVVIK